MTPEQIEQELNDAVTADEHMTYQVRVSANRGLVAFMSGYAAELMFAQWWAEHPELHDKGLSVQLDTRGSVPRFIVTQASQGA